MRLKGLCAQPEPRPVQSKHWINVAAIFVFQKGAAEELWTTSRFWWGAFPMACTGSKYTCLHPTGRSRIKELRGWEGAWRKLTGAVASESQPSPSLQRAFVHWRLGCDSHGLQTWAGSISPGDLTDRPTVSKNTPLAHYFRHLSPSGWAACPCIPDRLQYQILAGPSGPQGSFTLFSHHHFFFGLCLFIHCVVHFDLTSTCK